MYFLNEQLALSPESSPADRYKATEFCESFRTNSSPAELCSVGLIFLSSAEGQIVLAGFQFIEYVAQFQWSQLEERDEVKVSGIEEHSRNSSTVDRE